MVHERLGHLPLKTVLEPSITAARSGVIINKAQAYLIKILEPILTHSQAGLDLFRPNGELLNHGDRFQNPAFADFLEILVHERARYFYQGDGAELILKTIGEKGLITRECLASYGVVERNPLKTSFMGKTIYTNPPPSTGGALITFLLQLLDQTAKGSASDFINLVKAMQVTSMARREICHDAQDTSQISQVQETNTFNHYLKLFNSGFNSIPNEPDPPSQGATTHVSILDNQGNVASGTTTNGQGCGYVIPEMGIMLNNMLGEDCGNRRKRS